MKVKERSLINKMTNSRYWEYKEEKKIRFIITLDKIRKNDG